MQFIETSVIGTRSAVLTFRRPGSPLTFLLVPMVHVAEQAFYDQVSVRLRACELIVAEGEPRARLPLHRKLARLRVDALVHQSVGFDPESFGIPILWPDAEKEPVKWLYAVLDAITAVPDWLILLRFPSKAFDITDLTGADGWAGGGSARVWRKLMLHERDKELLACLARIDRERSGEAIMVGLPWGALHMVAVSGYLFSELGYRVVAADWLTVRGGR